MANFETADLSLHQAKITQAAQSGELRFRDPAVMRVLRRSTELMIPSHNAIKNAGKRTDTEINYVKRTKRALGTGGEIHNHTGAKGDSAIIIPAWNKYDDKFTYSIKQANDSLYSLDEQVTSELFNLLVNFSEGYEDIAVAFLHNNRSGVNAYNRQGAFNATNDVFEITEDLTSITSTGYRAMQIAKSAMGANNWDEMNNVILCDSVAFDKFETMAAQGAANKTNLSFQFGGNEYVKSYQLDALAVALGYASGYWLMMNQGTYAALDWIPEQNRNGVSTKVNQYGTLIHPETGLLLATHQYEERADTTASNGDVQDVKIEVQAFNYLSLNLAPLSTVNETPVQAFGFVAPVIAE
jgi:hypothetical protein